MKKIKGTGLNVNNAVMYEKFDEPIVAGSNDYSKVAEADFEGSYNTISTIVVESPVWTFLRTAGTLICAFLLIIFFIYCLLTFAALVLVLMVKIWALIELHGQTCCRVP